MLVTLLRGLLVVAQALAVWIGRFPPPAAGVLFKFLGTSLQLIIFRRPGAPVHLAPPPPGTEVKGSASRKLDLGTSDIDIIWVQEILNTQGFAYTVTSGTSDADLTAAITVYNSYAQSQSPL